MKNKCKIFITTALLVFTSLVLTACGRELYDGIDYSKYNYYGSYSFSNKLNDNGGRVYLNFTLYENGRYEMDLDVYQTNSFVPIQVTEVGLYVMEKLNEPLYDENMQVIYDLYFLPTYSSGIAYPDTISGDYGYVTEQYLNSCWWVYADNFNEGATVYCGDSEYSYKMIHENNEDILPPEQEGGENQTPIIPETPKPTECFHEDIKTEEVCFDCGLECYVKIGKDVLMYSAERDIFVAEFYSETATSVFEVFKSRIKTVYISNKVKTIAEHAFNSYVNLGNLIIENGLENIESGAFSYCEKLTSVVLPSSIINIEYSAFNGCSELENIEIGSEVKTVGNFAFTNTKWWDNQEDNAVIYLNKVCIGVKGELPMNSVVDIKDGTLSIANNAFYGQGGLRTVNLPTSLKNIGEHAFYNCIALINVNSGGNVEYVSSKSGDCPFEKTAYLENAYNDGIFYFDKVLVKADNLITKCVIKEGISAIADYAFYRCKNLKDITIPSCIKNIGQYAFNLCSAEIYCEVEEKPSDWSDVWRGDVWDVYWYKESEPELNADGTDYDGNYWHYVDGVVTPWVYGEEN